MADETLTARAEEVLTVNKYMVLGTVTPDGAPWVSPVYFTPDGHTDFYWVSSPDARHSVNLRQDPRVSITIFDSSVPVGQAAAVYLSGTAAEVPDDELVAAAELYSARLAGIREFTPDELREPADLRLYRARVTEHWLLVRGRDPEYGTGVDSRVPVWD